MNRLLLDIVQDGQIPIYAAPTRGMRYYTHTEELVWDPRRATNKILISVGVDHRLDSIREFLGTELLRDEGTLIFAVRYVEALTRAFQNTPTLFVLGGMAFVPGANTLGTPLENGDPWPIVRQFIHTTYRLQKGLEPDTAHPIIDDAVQRYLAGRTALDVGVQRSEARDKALAILTANLDPVQRKEFLERGHFHVVGQDGRTYRIDKKHTHGVHRIEGGVKTFEYCLVADVHIPTFDLMLMQKLLLESDTTHFLEKANAWDLRGGKRKFLRGGHLAIVDPSGVVVKHGEEEAPGAPG